MVYLAAEDGLLGMAAFVWRRMACHGQTDATAGMPSLCGLLATPLCSRMASQNSSTSEIDGRRKETGRCVSSIPSKWNSDIIRVGTNLKNRYVRVVRGMKVKELSLSPSCRGADTFTKNYFGGRVKFTLKNVKSGLCVSQFSSQTIYTDTCDICKQRNTAQYLRCRRAQNLFVARRTSDGSWGSVGTKVYERAEQVCTTKQVPRSEFCNGNCLIPRDELDANCTVTDEAFEKFRKSVRFTGKKEEGIPRWEIFHDTRGRVRGSVRGSGRLLGEVACPCKHGNVRVTADEALKRIVGQVAKLGIGERTAEAALGHETIKDKDLAAPVGWNAKVALATYDMINCWKSRCLGEIGENAGPDGDAALQLGGTYINGGGSWCW